MSSRAIFAWDLVRNITGSADVHYVTESKHWSIYENGSHLSHAISAQNRFDMRMTSHPLGVMSGIVHFGSFRTALWRQYSYPSLSRIKRIWTIFHIIPELAQYKCISTLSSTMAVIHTSSSITRQELIKRGVPPKKIVVIPLGVNTRLYNNTVSRYEMRRRLGLKDEEIAIGSFQKDGHGWGDGCVPKLEKGPDVFVAAMKRLRRQLPIVAILVGPARGYVEEELKKAGVPYRSAGLLPLTASVAEYYQALDLYLISSRIEGGPKSLLESWAAGVPVVTTRVGMVPDIATHKVTAMIYEPEDTLGLVSGAAEILLNADLRAAVVAKAGDHVRAYDWFVIAEQYSDELYSKLL